MMCRQCGAERHPQNGTAKEARKDDSADSKRAHRFRRIARGNQAANLAETVEH